MTGLLDDLRVRGVRLWADGEHLRLDAAAGKVSERERDQLAARKGEVLALLEAEGLTAGDPALWDRLLESAEGELRARLERFRRRGCALRRLDGRVYFGPFDDYAGCAWSDALSWQRDYDRNLRPLEQQLRTLLASLLSVGHLTLVGGGW